RRLAFGRYVVEPPPRRDALIQAEDVDRDRVASPEAVEEPAVEARGSKRLLYLTYAVGHGYLLWRPGTPGWTRSCARRRLAISIEHRAVVRVFVLVARCASILRTQPIDHLVAPVEEPLRRTRRVRRERIGREDR